MKTVTWELKETFHFPQLYGSPSDVPNIKIVPQSNHSVTGDSVRINGIYHIAASVEFKPFEGTYPRPYDGVVIDFIEMRDDEDLGYFEYAVPLTVDIPRERIREGFVPNLEVRDVKMNYPFPGCVEVCWNVACSYAEPGAAAEEPVGMKGAATVTLDVEEEMNMADAVEVKAETVEFESPSSSTPEYFEVVEDTFSEDYEAYEEPVAPQAVKETVVQAVEVVEDSPAPNRDKSELNFLNDLKDTYSVFTFRTSDYI